MRIQAYACIGRTKKARANTVVDDLPLAIFGGQEAGMWDQPYLETCCRSALHRLVLCGALGRPPGLKDGPCLRRLAGLGLAIERDDGRYGPTEAGLVRHESEILKSRLR
jgi:hypothetical protein